MDWNCARTVLLGLAAAVACQAARAQAIEEIVVTARRQGEEKLMETPLAITAFDANAIESRGISNLQDVANLTPGLSFFNPLGEVLPTPVIRGVVPQDIFGENAAAVFIDGVYVSGREGLNFSQLDIERIEVLKGPQSSAYGRNAFSGAINYVTKVPSDVFEAKVEGEVGNRGKQKIMGQVSGPIWGETLTGRVSLLYDDWDGSYDNTASWRDIGGYRYRSYQGKLRWRPADSLDVNWAIYHSNDEIDDFAVASLLANCEPKVLQTVDNVAASSQPRLQNWCGRLPKLEELPDALDPATFDDTRYPGPLPLAGSIRRDALPHIAETFGQKRDVTRSNLNISWEAGYGTLSSLTGYSYLREMEDQDFNHSTGYGTPLVVCPSTSNLDPPACDVTQPWRRIPIGVEDYEAGPRVEEWSQELRFTSPRDQRLRWQAGGYFYHSVTEDHKQGLLQNHTADPLPDWFDISPTGGTAIGPVALPTNLAIGSYIFGGSFYPFGGMDPLERFNTKEQQKSWSLFGSLDYDITDQLKGRIELRHTVEHRWADGYNYTPCLSPTPGSAYPASTDLPVADCGNAYYDLRVLDPVGYDSWVKDAEYCSPSGAPRPADCNGDYRLTHVAGVEGGSARFDNTTGRIGLDYKLDSGWMVYGSIAYAEKPGGIRILPSMEVIDPTGGVKLSTVVNRFDPEKMTAYEFGVKGYTPDRRIRFDLAMFFNDWRDVVLRQLTEVDPVTGLQFRQPQGLNVNSGDAHVFGWELTTDVGLTENLSGRLTVGYTDSKMVSGKLDSFSLFPSFYTTDPNCAPAQIQTIPDPTPGPPPNTNEAQAAVASHCQSLSGDISGKTQMRQPPWTASLSLDYRRQLFGDWDLVSSLSGNFIDRIYLGNDNQGWAPSRTVANFSIGMTSPRYTVQLWVRNLFDDDKPLSAFRDILWTNDSDIHASVPTGTGSIRNISTFDDFPPLRMSVNYPSLRTWGLTARMRFGGSQK
ncbi:MAG: TonB-dependent receptor [Gammaproteobacteria bacterium]|nr:TonB-dependent receptor [Gammaproteobacteria bacterium]QOJ31154.1 MAG: TonB-dependent receptor [Gammaproteobacteria bacterium]